MSKQPICRAILFGSLVIAAACIYTSQANSQSDATERADPALQNPFEGKQLSCTTSDGTVFHLQDPKFTGVMGRPTLFGSRLALDRDGERKFKPSGTVYLPWDTVVGVVVHEVEPSGDRT